jgi:hypothetical protein
VHGSLDLVLQFLHGQYDIYIDHVIEMMRYTFQFAGDIVPDRRGDLQVVTGEVQVHAAAPLIKASFSD